MTQNTLNSQKGAPSVLHPKLPNLLKNYRKGNGKTHKSNHCQNLRCILTHKMCVNTCLVAARDSSMMKLKMLTFTSKLSDTKHGVEKNCQLASI